MENRAKFGIIHIYRRSVAWEEAGLGIAEEVNSRRVGENVRSAPNVYTRAHNFFLGTKDLRASS